MKILILGSGGREHTIAWKFGQSSLCEKLYIAPGNAGTAGIAENLNLDILDFDSLKHEVLYRAIDFVVVGPEAPLVEGVVDYFQRDGELRHIPILGPDRVAAQLEGSKSYAKSFMHRHGIPTAGYFEVTSDNLPEGMDYLSGLEGPYVLKADGLAAGKGVLIIEDLEEAKLELRAMIEGKFGHASRKVVIEEFLDGIEFSVFVLTDGQQYVLLPEAKDYKRVGVGDTGLNTGGMGSVSPVSFFEGAFRDKVIQRIVEPTIDGIRQDGLHYSGFVFFGLIKVGEEPFVIEYNCRMGDPETQSVLPRIEDDLLEMSYKAATQNLDSRTMNLTPETACSVVVVAEGYPGTYRKGDAIEGLDQEDVLIFHAGTSVVDSRVVTNGGRVLAITALDIEPEKATQKALAGAKKVQCEAGIYFRTDIGQDLLKLKSAQ